MSNEMLAHALCVGGLNFSPFVFEGKCTEGSTIPGNYLEIVPRDDPSASIYLILTFHPFSKGTNKERVGQVISKTICPGTILLSANRIFVPAMFHEKGHVICGFQLWENLILAENLDKNSLTRWGPQSYSSDKSRQFSIRIALHLKSTRIHALMVLPNFEGLTIRYHKPQIHATRKAESDRRRRMAR
jgi:hypothetical protein